MWTGSVGSRYGPVAGFYEHGSGHSSLTKGGNFLDKLNDFQLPVFIFAVWIL
jgi:hypothetical protein